MSETLYYLSSPATDSFENLSADAERRAKERGCECPRPEFLHFVDPSMVTCIVRHTSPACPLRPEVTS